MLHRRAGQRGLGVRLEVRAQRAEQRGSAADGDQGQAPPARLLRAGEVEQGADHHVDRDLHHRPAHRRGGEGGCGGVRERQPGVQRREARLGARPEQHEREEGGGRSALRWCSAQRGEGEVAAVGTGRRDEREGGDETQAGERGEAKIQSRGAALPRGGVVRRDEGPGGERHRLEAEEQREHVAREQGEQHAREEERPGGEGARRVRAARDAVQRGGDSAQPDDQREPGREGIKRELQRREGRAEGQREHFALPPDQRQRRHRRHGAAQRGGGAEHGPRAKGRCRRQRGQQRDEEAEGRKHSPTLPAAGSQVQVAPVLWTTPAFRRKDGAGNASGRARA